MRRSTAVLALALLLVLGPAAWLLMRDDARAPHRGGATPDLAAAVLRAPAAPAPRTESLPHPVATPDEPPSAPRGAAPASQRPVPFAVAGSVRRSTGIALRGAHVELLGPMAAAGAPAVLASLVTRDDGAFRLESGGERPSGLRVTWSPCYEALGEGSAWDEPLPRAPLVRSVEFPAGRPLPQALEVTLDTGWSLAGRVTDMQGAGLEGAFLFAGKLGPETRTDVEGRFVLQDIERLPTAIAFTASAPFRARQVIPLEAPPAGEWRVQQDFALSRAGSVSGFVIDPDGRALPGAEVRALVAGAPDGELPAEIASTSADASGRYTLGDLPDGVYDLVCCWMVHAPGDDPASDVRRSATLRGVDVRADAPVSADFRLTHGVALSGRVVDREGTPFRSSHSVEYWSLVGGGPAPATLLAAARTDLDAEGAFVFTGLDPGPGELRVLGLPYGDEHTSWSSRDWRKQPPPELPWTRQVGGGTGRHITSGWIVEHVQRLELPPDGLSGLEVRQGQGGGLGGLVVDGAGRALAGVSVRLLPEGLAEDPVITGPDGVFRIWLPGRSWPSAALLLSDAVHVPALLELPATSGFEQLGRIVLERAPALKLRVVDDESGEVLADARASWQLYGGSRRERAVHVAPLGAEPVLLRADRTEGDWVLTVESPEHRPWRRTARIQPGEDPTEVTVRLVHR